MCLHQHFIISYIVHSVEDIFYIECAKWLIIIFSFIENVSIHIFDYIIIHCKLFMFTGYYFDIIVTLNTLNLLHLVEF